MKYIRFSTDTQTFYLHTERTTYAFCINELNEPEHLYYGARIPEEDIRHGADTVIRLLRMPNA